MEEDTGTVIGTISVKNGFDAELVAWLVLDQETAEILQDALSLDFLESESVVLGARVQ